jgi:hypothetical protein
MTGLDLVASAMRLIGALASGETPSAAEANDGLVCLNDMLDSWQAERLMIFTINIQEFPLVPGQQVYTLGPGGNFNTVRPAKIERMSIVSLNNPAQPLELPIHMYTDRDWQHVPVKTGITSTLPLSVYDDGGYPLRNLSFWVIPNIVNNVRIYSWTALTNFPDLTTDITFPPGYKEAVRYNLAARLIAEMPGEYAQVTVLVTQQLAVDSLARVKTMNLPTIQAFVPALPGGSGGGHYDYRSDSIVGQN